MRVFCHIFCCKFSIIFFTMSCNNSLLIFQQACTKITQSLFHDDKYYILKLWKKLGILKNKAHLNCKALYIKSMTRQKKSGTLNEDSLFQNVSEFWFATGGAGFCVSRTLALKMAPFTAWVVISVLGGCGVSTRVDLNKYFKTIVLIFDNILCHIINNLCTNTSSSLTGNSTTLLMYLVHTLQLPALLNT